MIRTTEREAGHDASVLSWVRQSHAHLDVPLWRAVSDWLATAWPFAFVYQSTSQLPEPSE